MRFSIVTPSFGQLDWLELCIASVRDQVPLPVAQNASSASLCVEHIVQDAGTLGIEDFAKNHGAAFYRNGAKIFGEGGRRAAPPSDNSKTAPAKAYSLSIYSEKDIGMYDAINKGLSRAEGEICAYLNCDEQYLEGALQSVASWFSKNPAIEIAFGNIVVTDSFGNYICDRTAVLPDRWHTMTSGNLSVFSAAIFFRRSVVERGFVFDPTWRIIGDSIWILSLLKAGLKGKLLRQRLASFAYSHENLSQQQTAIQERKRLHAMAPTQMRVFSPIAIARSRFRRILAGGYSIKPHRYKIFTRTTPDYRCEFQVLKPTHRWPTAN
jgi:glycosyltransferase involved in cell wall biosynthesis